MRCDNKGQSTAHHYGWMLVVLIIFGVSTYIFTLNRPDVKKGGYQMDYHPQDWPLSIHIGEGSCARLDSTKGLKNALNSKSSN